MADFDEACRYAAKMDEAGFFAWLLGADAGLVFVRWLDARTVALPGSGDRTGDLIAELAEGGVGPFWAVPVEFQVRPDADMMGRLLELLGRLWKQWRTAGPALDRYECVRVCCLEAGEDFHTRHSRHPDGSDLKRSALTLLHARACLVASEVQALLRSGHAAGAQVSALT